MKKASFLSAAFVIVLVLGPLMAKAQTGLFMTYGGDGVCSNNHNDSLAVRAGIYDPGYCTFDKTGNFYFSSSLGNVIRKIDTAGIITTIAGTGTAGFSGDSGLAINAELREPNGLAFDTLGNLYFADGYYNRIRKIDTGGIITTFAGTGIGSYGGDNGPALLANLYTPNGICFDKFGNLYIADANNIRIRKINATGIITTVAGTGVGGFSGDNGLADTSMLSEPVGVATDDSGNLYIADVGITSNRVRKVNSSGIITTVAGNGIYTYTGDNIPATTAQISPNYITFDRSGLLYISDRYNFRIFKIDSSGVIHSLVGNGVQGFGGDNGLADTSEIDPGGSAFDFCNNLYICDVGFCRVQKVTFNPTCSPADTITSVNKIVPNSFINIYPNPAYNTLTISSPNKINNVAIMNMLGQTLYSRECKGEKIEVDVSGLASGVYFVQITNDSGIKEVKKIVKE